MRTIPQRLGMSVFVALAVTLLPAGAVGQTAFYVRAGASGARTGTNWTDAYARLPTTLVRNATYYLADGRYDAAVDFSTPEAGSSYIFIKKATASAHGTDAGWDPSFGDGEAAFIGTWTFTTGFWDIDGVVGGGPGASVAEWPSVWKAGFGITQTVPTGGNANIQLSGAIGRVGFRFRHLALINQQPENSTGTSYGRIFHLESGGQTNASDVVVEYVYVPAFMGVPFHVWGAHDWVVQFCFFDGDGLGNDSNVHRELWSGVGNDRWTFRWNYIKDINNSAVIGFVNEGGLTENVHFYGNIIDYRAGGQSPSFFVDMDPGLASNWQFFNNTVVAWNGGSPAFHLNGGTGVFRNNLFANHLHSYGPGLDGTVSHNAFFNLVRSGVGDVTASWASNGSNSQILSSDPFANYPARDLRLRGPTQPGTATGSPSGNAVDLFGHLRGADGVWDRGALEYVANTPAPPRDLRVAP